MSKHTTIRTIKHTFTKWGRTVTGTEKRLYNKPWTCQACASEIPYEIDPYLFQIGENEYIRICHICQKKVLDHNIKNLARLIRICRLNIFDIKL